VGTLALPDDVAHPTRLLAEAEMQLVHQHPLIGERILSAMPALRPLAPVVRSSYENWDGTGFPDGLAGAHIPLAARIVAVSAARAQALADTGEAADCADPLVGLQVAGKLDPDLVRLSARTRRRLHEPPAG